MSTHYIKFFFDDILCSFQLIIILILVFMFSAALVSSGGAIYPIGWDNREVKESCGNISGPYKLGKRMLSQMTGLLNIVILKYHNIIINMSLAILAFVQHSLIYFLCVTPVLSRRK